MKKLLPIPEKYFRRLVWLVIAAGILIRIVVYFQNRNLFIDEANVARNIFERGYTGLAQPLKYEQYAPPVFLWLVKTWSLLLGMGEKALRLQTLLSGILSFFVLKAILKNVSSFRSMWYPLALFAVGAIFIRYSTELKQYMSDVLIVLSLLLLALKKDLFTSRSIPFFIIWVLAGTLAIWTSMPSVFALAGVGCYYGLQSLQRKNYRKLFLVISMSILWIAQFGFYYLAILKPQANTDYLQNFHQGYFLFLIPDGLEQLKHNYYVLQDLIRETGGFTALASIFNILLLVAGGIWMLRKKTSSALLFIIPIAGALLAAAVHQYSLIPRVALFLMPLFLILMGVAFEQLMRLKIKAIPAIFAIVAVICVKNFNMIRYIWEPLKVEEVTEELTFLKKYNIHGPQLYVNHGARPAFIYYTEIHPGKAQWAQFENAHKLWWDARYDTFPDKVPDTSAFIYTSISFDELQHLRSQLEPKLRLIDMREDQYARCYAYIYKKE